MSSTEWDQLNKKIIKCKKCPRLRAHCKSIAETKRKSFQDWDYWGKPVPNFGPQNSDLLILGLAPAAHGANRTGRMFTGDRSGDWLYRALHKAGFANQTQSISNQDGLKLRQGCITAICHCAPPDNKPTTDEVSNCGNWLQDTLNLSSARIYLALGGIAWDAFLGEAKSRGLWTGRKPKFAHGAQVELTNESLLIASYHPSQQNTFTGRLTEKMFDAIFQKIRAKIDKEKK